MRLFNCITPGTDKGMGATEDRKRRLVEVNGLAVDVTFKRIKNIYLKVMPPEGAIKISAPKRMNIKAVRAFVDSKADWIKRHRDKIIAREHQPLPRYMDAEIHHVWGKPYLLCVDEDDHAPFVELDQTGMILHVRSGTDTAKRREIVELWRRDQVKKAAWPLIAKWEQVMGVTVSRFCVRRMKTRWGSCSCIKCSIRLNTSLSAKAPEFLEYVVVHEMVHFLEPSHNGRFAGLMDRFLPKWRDLRRCLNQRQRDRLTRVDGG